MMEVGMSSSCVGFGIDYSGSDCDQFELNSDQVEFNFGLLCIRLYSGRSCFELDLVRVEYSSCFGLGLC